MAVRAAVGPHITLRADANRGWSLEQAVAFARACGYGGSTRGAGAGSVGLEYVEEPVRAYEDLPRFHQLTGGAAHA